MMCCSMCVVSLCHVNPIARIKRQVDDGCMDTTACVGDNCTYKATSGQQSRLWHAHPLIGMSHVDQPVRFGIE
jgi:hypothetical protein